MVPPGYERLLLGHAVAVARSDLAAGIRQALIGPDGKRWTLLEYAARHRQARTLKGRGAAYAAPLPRGTTRVVVRHNRHGGLFAPVTRDLFLPPTRAPYELEASLALRALDIPTPEVLAYVVYNAGILFRRVDVCSGEIVDSFDLAHVITSASQADRPSSLAATATLLARLARAGVRHHDLNAKNILLSRGQAWVLDVDRVVLRQPPERAFEANIARLGRSLRKWRDQQGARVSEREIDDLRSAARHEFDAP